MPAITTKAGYINEHGPQVSWTHACDLKPQNMKKEPQTDMLGHGYHAADYYGSMKQPIYQTSTYEFPNSQAGKDYFAWATGKEEMPEGSKMGKGP